MAVRPEETLDALAGHKTALRAFISASFKGYEPADTEDIFATGNVNSLFAIELITFIEGEFGIEVDTDDLELDNFRSIDAVARLVDRKHRG